MKAETPNNWKALGLLAVVTLACLAPFLNQAFHMDDPLFIWSARQIQNHPLDFYGFNLNWTGKEEPMASVTQNPPLAAYYLALVGSLFGWSELALHAGFLVPALAVVFGTFYLARNFCSQPLAAALVTVTAPVFLLSSTSVMCDTMMLAFWVWSVFFWVEGLKAGSSWKLWVAALLMSAGCLTKYFGFSLVPLLLVYSVAERRRVGWWLVCFLVPVIVLGVYQWWAAKLYGHGLLGNAVSYATSLRVGGGVPAKILAGLAFTGGCIIMLLLAAPWLWGRKTLVVGLPLLGVVGLSVVVVRKFGLFQAVEAGNVKWLFLVQMTLWVAAGAGVFLLAATDWWRQKNAASTLLLLWIAGTFVFTCAVNWTVSGRNILPMLPAVSLLVARQLEQRGWLADPHRRKYLLLPLGCSLVVALLVAEADYQQANSARAAARFLAQESPAKSSDLWFEGHWGFQYYLEPLGGRPLDRTRLDFKAGEAVVIPAANSYLFPLPQERVGRWFTYEARSCRWLTTMNSRLGAGYYSDGWGPAPFLFAPVPAETYLVFRAN